VIERFLFRLSRSQYAQQFILKGALMLRVWHVPIARPTMDIDMLGQVPNSVETLIEVVRECLAVVVEDDGLRFNASSIRGEAITLDAEYQGVRIRVRGSLGNARLSLQLDFGFGDIFAAASGKPFKMKWTLGVRGSQVRNDRAKSRSIGIF
jgi:hypothetical protein